MKFDDQLAAYLYENKSLRLEGIGTFTLAGNASVPQEHDKEIYYPIEGLSFVYDRKSDTDENLIAFLVKKLGKIQPLIRSDLESYLSNIKQFINLGKPYTIEGVGTLSKNNFGTYEFTPGNFLPVKEELNPKRENDEHNYPVRSQSSAGKVLVGILIVVAALAVLGGIGWGVSSLLSKSKSPDKVEVQDQGYLDTIPQETTVENTTASSEDNAATIQEDQSTDTIRYRMIFETTKSMNRAIARTRQLNTLRSRTTYDTIRINDSLRYRLFLPVRIRPVDTTRYKDSLKIFFGHPIKVEKQ